MKKKKTIFKSHSDQNAKTIIHIFSITSTIAVIKEVVPIFFLTSYLISHVMTALYKLGYKWTWKVRPSKVIRFVGRRIYDSRVHARGRYVSKYIHHEVA